MSPQNPENNDPTLSPSNNPTPPSDDMASTARNDAPQLTQTPMASNESTTSPMTSSESASSTSASFAAPAAAPLATPKKSPKKLILIISAVIVGLLLIGGSVAFAVWYMSPQKVLNDSLTNLMNTPPQNTDLTGSITVKEATFGIAATSYADNDSNTQTNLKLDISGGDNAVNINVDAITAKNGDLYLRLNDAKKLMDQFTQGSPEAAAMFEGVLSKVDSKWVKITLSDLKEFTGQEKSADTKCVTEAFEAFQKDETQKKEVRDAYAKNQFITVKEQKADETIDGRNSFHYVLNTDQAKAKSFGEALKSTQIYKKIESCLGDSAKDDSKYETRTEDDDTVTSLEIWIDKSTRRLSKVGVTSSSVENKGNAKISAILGYNTKSISLPTTTTSIKDLQQEIQNMFSSPAPLPDELDYETSVRMQ